MSTTGPDTSPDAVTPATADTAAPVAPDSGAVVEELKLSQVRRLSGVSVDTLRMLAEDKVLPGVVRTASGHVYVRSDAVPTHSQVVELLEQQLRRSLELARRHLRRVQVEMEAVGNDIDLAIEDPAGPLGHDLLTLRTRATQPNSTTLTSALGALEEASWDVRRYHQALRDTGSVTAALTD